jgi:hypothetical protein
MTGEGRRRECRRPGGTSIDDVRLGARFVDVGGDDLVATKC